MKYNKIFSVGIRESLLVKISQISRDRQISRNKLIRDALNSADYSKVEIKPHGTKIIYNKNDRKVAVSVRFEENFVNNLTFIAEMKNKTRDEVINEVLESQMK